MAIPSFQVRDDDRMERRIRRRMVGRRQRIGRRDDNVVDGVIEPDSEDSGSEFEDSDNETSTIQPSAQTQTSAPLSTIAPPPPAPTITTSILATLSTSTVFVTTSVS